MDHGDITVADDPFGVFQEPAELEPVHDPDAAITAPCTKNGTDGGVVEHLLKICRALVIGPCKRIAPPEQVFAEYHIQSPRPDDINGRHDFLFGQTAGRGRYADGITGAKEGRSDHGEGYGLNYTGI